jgi:hypothetical protein
MTGLYLKVGHCCFLPCFYPVIFFRAFPVLKLSENIDIGLTRYALPEEDRRYRKRSDTHIFSIKSTGGYL